MLGEINLRFKLTEGDLVTATRAVMMRSIVARLIILVCLGGLILVAVGAIFFGFDPMRVSSQILLMFTLGFLLPLLGPVILIRLRRDTKTSEEQAWRLTDSGVSIRTQEASSTLSWKSFTQTVESGRFYYLHLSTRVVLILPKRVFESRDQEITFRDLVKRKTKFS